MRRPLLAGLAIGVSALTACASGSGTAQHGGSGTAQHSGRPLPGRCVAPAGGRCPVPEPVRTALVKNLLVSSDGRTISGRFRCGGRLDASQTPRRVVLTYHASRVRAGGMACAMVPLSVHLATPLGARVVVDGVSGRPLLYGAHPAPRSSR